MAANTPTTPPAPAPGMLAPIMQKVAPPLIWMGIGFLAATWFYKPKRA